MTRRCVGPVGAAPEKGERGPLLKGKAASANQQIVRLA